MFKLLLVAAAVAAAAPTAAVSQTAERIHVRYADLNLTTPAGRTRLDRRIAAAIERFCPGLDSAELPRRAVAQRCQRRVTASVAAQRDRVVAAAAGRRDVAALDTGSSTGRAN